ncbi:CHASE2 domain-containing protein [bacterium]|nr:CHASE2 domain-containing protein [bacterium]
MALLAYFNVTFYEVAELKTYDQRFLLRTAIFGPVRMDPNLATVDVDNATLTHEGRWQDWTRDKHTKIIRALHEFGAAMLGFDVFFVEPSRKSVAQEQLQELEAVDRASVLKLIRDYDAEMAVATRETGNVYLGQFLEELEEGDRVSPLEPARQEALAALEGRGFITPYPEAGRSTIRKIREIHPPLKPLVEAARGVGFAQAFPDLDGTRRRFPLVLLYENRLMPSLALIMLCDYLRVPLASVQIVEGKHVRLPGAHLPGGRVKDISVPIDAKGQMLVNWAGEFLQTFLHYPHVTISLLAQDRKALDALRAVKQINIERPEAMQDPERLLDLARQRGIDDAGLVTGYQASLQAASLMEQAVLADPQVRTAHVFAQLFGLPTDQVPADLGPDSPAEAILKFAPSDDYVGQIRDLLKTLDDVRVNNLVAQRMEKNGLAPPEQVAAGLPGLSADRVRRSLETLRYNLRGGQVQPEDRPLFFPPLPPITFVNRGKQQPVTAEDMKGKILFYGLTATATHDLNPTPYEPAYPLVGIYPNVFNTVLTENFLRKAPGWLNDLVILGLGLLIGLTIPRFKALDGAIWMLILLIVYVVGAFLLFTHGGIWIDVVGPVSTLVLGYLSITLYNYVQKEKEKDFVQGAFGHFLDPKVVENLVEHPELVEQLGGEERVMTAFFSDIASFSTISENLTPTGLVTLLNQYLTEMCEIIAHHGGTIDKFEGDMIIAFYGAPIPYEDHAERAALACIDQQEKLVELRRGWEERGEFAELRKKWADEGRGEFLRARMGVNTGPMVVGNMGSRTRVDYTIMGDAVNLASRLEGAGKQYNVVTMITQDTYEQAKGVIEARQLDAIRVVGKEEPVKVYEILGRRGQVAPARAEAAALFAKGYEMYAQQYWDEAIAYFEAALKAYPHDGPSQIFTKRCQAFKLNPPPANWDAVHTLESK